MPLSLPITFLTTLPLAILYVGLVLNVVAYRMSNKISFGDGDDKELLRRMRAHGNLIESAPFGLILVALVELSGASCLFVAALAALLVIGRLSHAYSFVKKPMNFRARQAGTVCTLFLFLTASGYLAVIGIMAL